MGALDGRAQHPSGVPVHQTSSGLPSPGYPQNPEDRLEEMMREMNLVGKRLHEERTNRLAAETRVNQLTQDVRNLRLELAATRRMEHPRPMREQSVQDHYTCYSCGIGIVQFRRNMRYCSNPNCRAHHGRRFQRGGGQVNRAGEEKLSDDRREEEVSDDSEEQDKKDYHEYEREHED